MIFPVCSSCHKDENKSRQWLYIIPIAYYAHGQPFFCNTCPCTENNVPVRFEGFRTFLYYEFWVNVPVAMFFPFRGLASSFY